MTRSDTLLSYPLAQFPQSAHLACTLSSTLAAAATTTTTTASISPPSSPPSSMPPRDQRQQYQQHHHHHHHHHARPPLDKPPCVRDNIPIPSSVKGAPPHLRQVIRKRQNSESAKRSRQRRKESTSNFYQHFDQQCQRISILEKRVALLTDLVKKKQALEAAAAAAAASTDVSPDQDTPDAPVQPTLASASVQNAVAKQELIPLHHMHPPEPAEEPVPERQEKSLLPVLHDKLDVDTAPPSVDILDHSLSLLHPSDFTSDAAIAFEQDIEVLLDSCVQMQDSLGDAFLPGSPFN